MTESQMTVLIAMLVLVTFACGLLAVVRWREAVALRRAGERRRRVRAELLREELGRLHGRYRQGRRR